MADYYQIDKKIAANPSVVCGSCEFKTSEEDVQAGLKSGFQECWKECFGWSDDDWRTGVSRRGFSPWFYQESPVRGKDGQLKN
ncbi:MAG: hypothetical protein PHZ11_07940 [Desulfitobacteriaceae bacterium]|nr:hypothetical protein [Desulfitobacteriaceae bacterium]